MEAGNGKREAGMAQDRRAIRTYEDIEGYTIVAKQLHRLSETWQSFDDGKPETILHPASRVTHPASKE
jgi:hypothetical protein